MIITNETIKNDLGDLFNDYGYICNPGFDDEFGCEYLKCISVNNNTEFHFNLHKPINTFAMFELHYTYINEAGIRKYFGKIEHRIKNVEEYNKFIALCKIFIVGICESC